MEQEQVTIKRFIDDVKNGKIKVVASSQILAEGFTVPDGMCKIYETAETRRLREAFENKAS